MNATREMVIHGMKFSLTAAELRTLIQDQAACLREWIDKADLNNPKYAWRCALWDLLTYGADHLESEATYELDRHELMALFEVFGD